MSQISGQSAHTFTQAQQETLDLFSNLFELTRYFVGTPQGRSEQTYPSVPTKF